MTSIADEAPKPIGIESHRDYTPLAPLLSRYPRQAGPLFHAYHHLVHSAAWTDVAPVDIRGDDESDPAPVNSGSGWGALIGMRPQGTQPELLLPCHVTDNLSVAYFQAVFSSLETQAKSRDGLQTGHILLAILSPDSTVVYYKLAKGLVKPVN
ncbi:hypothetical protein BDZ90DRAFT_261927 [Jaminaea rosea]|uniref:tRNA-splicing endonuclease subunit Sen15 domain-containing protein n=1 Tax=Jaminaea rosea TaxID=1569628 RepID=A0A316UMZ0_9BASI|nr:hypothetical protein BDZ90DRAFT_261927 [Jaminaea rosea]PWN25721.1 hypothetical protein BDZ90DRAFT_261927 [Jaminaea rosea]